MIRVFIELYGEAIEGLVVDGTGAYVAVGDLDLESSFIVRCDDGELFIIHGWLVDIDIISAEAIQ